ncbi:polysaccharide deacetylase family protein [Feifania hominis]|uniref:Polysaccharide deacetylase family protein n=1 Tax=Feifania hominis TaxID=2763660 RepID=A0A926HV05_9FIRM|nr:polysaccharide deacetylase family protein [Feifania hominis]MBC8536838.1 polysaccharide deacetylase family protein [Feifania hominis]
MKVFVVTKKMLGSFSVIALCLVLFFGINYRNTLNFIAAATEKRQIPIYNVDVGETKKVAISFDAAWGNEDTQMLIDILGKYNVKATFFVVGEWVDKYPESVKALADAGHDIQNHSSTHAHLPQLSRDQIAKEITDCSDKIEAVTGKKSNLIRPPYGDYSNSVLETAKEVGHYVIQWDVDSLDWKDPPSSDIVKRVTGKVKPGSIVLFHNAAKNTPAALPGVIEALQADGYEFVLINDLIYKDNYYIDHAGMQILNSESENKAG